MSTELEHALADLADLRDMECDINFAAVLCNGPADDAFGFGSEPLATPADWPTENGDIDVDVDLVATPSDSGSVPSPELATATATTKAVAPRAVHDSSGLASLWAVLPCHSVLACRLRECEADKFASREWKYCMHQHIGRSDATWHDIADQVSLTDLKRLSAPSYCVSCKTRLGPRSAKMHVCPTPCFQCGVAHVEEIDPCWWQLAKNELSLRTYSSAASAKRRRCGYENQ